MANITILAADGSLLANNGSNGISILAPDGSLMPNNGSNGDSIRALDGSLRVNDGSVTAYSILGTDGALRPYEASISRSILALDGSRSAADSAPVPNLLTNAAWAGGPPPTGWGTPISGTAVPNGTVDGNNIYRFTAVAQRPFIAQSGTPIALPATGTTTISVYVGTIHSGAVQISNMLSFGTTPAGGTTQYYVDGIARTAATNATANTRVSCVMTTTGTGANSTLRVGPGAGSNATVDIDLSRPKANVGSVAAPF